MQMQIPYSYVIWLPTGQCVTGFRHGQTGQLFRIEVNEVRIAELCHATLGSDKPYKFETEEGAKYIASFIPGAKVELWADE